MPRLHYLPLLLFLIGCQRNPPPPPDAPTRLTVREVAAPPAGPAVRIAQLRRDSTGPTSMRYYAPRSGMPTKVDDWAYRKGADNGGRHARYYYRDRDLGQTFTVGDTAFRLRALTVRIQPVDVAGADPTGAAVSLQLMRVDGQPVVDDNGTRAYVDEARVRETSPNGVSVWDGGGPYQGPCTNPLWSTYASDWPVDPSDAVAHYRWPVMHLSDDLMRGETYTHLALAGGGTIPAKLGPNDYLRWEVTGDNPAWTLQPNTTYAYVLLFDEPAPPGVKRNLPLSNVNVLPVSVGPPGAAPPADPFPAGHMIRRDGYDTDLEAVFIRDTTDRADLAASRRSSAFPVLDDGRPDRAARLAIPPGTLGYPDVDTYRDMWFVLEGELISK